MFTSPKVQSVLDEVEKLIGTRNDAWSIDTPSARFLHALALARRPKLTLEVGTSYGHSGLYLADAAARNRARFYTVEQNPKKVNIAKHYFLQAGVDHVTTVLQGSAPEILSEVPEGIEFLFLDAEKVQHNAYLDALLPKLGDRAVIVTDNATTHPDEMAPFLHRLRTMHHYTSVLVPIGHGMELTVRV